MPLGNAISRADRIVRRFVPSMVPLSHNRPLMSVLDAVDRKLAKDTPEFQGLPPNRLRLRTGVGNRVLLNQSQFLHIGDAVATYLLESGLAEPTGSILDVGCGCGRFAAGLRRQRFTGSYLGIDVDPEMIAWCQHNITTPEFRFQHVDAVNDLYNPAGGNGRYRLPVADASVDLVTSHSLFTHLLVDDLVNYVQESARVLRAQGRMAMTVFCLEHIQRFPEFGRRWTFRHRIGPALVENPRHAEAAVAYEEAYLVATAKRFGFAGVEIRPYGHQSWMIAVR